MEDSRTFGMWLLVTPCPYVGETHGYGAKIRKETTWKT